MLLRHNLDRLWSSRKLCILQFDSHQNHLVGENCLQVVHEKVHVTCNTMYKLLTLHNYYYNVIMYTIQWRFGYIGDHEDVLVLWDKPISLTCWVHLYDVIIC